MTKPQSTSWDASGPPKPPTFHCRTPTKASKDSKENREKQELWKGSVEKLHTGGKPLSTMPGKSTKPTPTKTPTPKESKENRDKPEQWKTTVEKAQYGVRTLCSTPGKSTRTVATMRFTTPPKPVVKRKILAENREFTVAPRKEEINDVTGGHSTKDDYSLNPVAASPTKEGQRSNQCQTGEEELSLGYSEPGSGYSGHVKSPLVSIEELQKRIQKFLEDEGSSAEVTIPLSPVDSIDSFTKLSVATCEEISLSGVEAAPYHPVFAPYSPRPEFLRARKSLSPARSEEFISSLGEKGGNGCQEWDNPTYDPKNNFLSPRPQFLRYRPLRRLELLRRSAEGMLSDLDLESPATDLDSSKRESEIDDIESQDLSQEVQSLSLPESDGTLSKGFSSNLLDQHCESIREKSKETKDGLDSLRLAQKVLEEELAAEEEEEILSALIEEVEVEEEDWLDDADSTTSNVGTKVFRSICGAASLFALVVVVLVVSGSPALLPVPLHHNYLSSCWKTSKSTEPVRQLLQTVEGLWTDNPTLMSGYLVSIPRAHMVQVGSVHFQNLVKSEHFALVMEIGKSFWWSFIKYSDTLVQYVKTTYAKFRAFIDDQSVVISSQYQEVNEWDWVPEYDFVVPQHMFNTTEAYENIIAGIMSWETKLLWSSLIESYGNYDRSQSITDLEDDETIQDSDSSIHSINSSMCFVSTRVEKHPVIRSAADGLIPYSKEPGEENGLGWLDPAAGEAVPASLVSGLWGQGSLIKRTNPADEPSQEGDVLASKIEAAAVQALEILPVEREAQSVFMEAGETRVGPSLVVIEVQPLESTLSDIRTFTEGLSSESSSWMDEAEGSSSFSNVRESEVNLNVPWESRPSEVSEVPVSQQGQILASGEDAATFQADELNAGNMVTGTTRTSFLHKFKSAPTLPFAAVVIVSLFLVVGAAILAFESIRAGKGNQRPGKLKKTRQRTTKVPQRPQRTYESNPSNLLERSVESNHLEGEPPTMQPSTELVTRFSMPSSSVTTPERLRDRELWVSAEEILHERGGPEVDDSSLGSVTVLLPVVQNEGTEKEQVKLTPVRRSSRIRTRLQSPSTSQHSYYH